MKVFYPFFCLLLLVGRGYSQTAEDERIALQFFQLREYDKAELLLKKQYDLNPDKFYEYLFKTYFQLRKYSDALEITKKILKSNGKKADYRYNLALTHDKLNDSVQAKKEWHLLNEAIGDNEFEVSAFLQKYMDARNWMMAEDLILKVQKKTKNKDAFVSNLLNIYIKQERYEEAVDLAFVQIENAKVNYIQLYSSYDFLQMSKVAQRWMERKIFAKLERDPNSDKWNELAMQSAIAWSAVAG